MRRRRGGRIAATLVAAAVAAAGLVAVQSAIVPAEAADPPLPETVRADQIALHSAWIGAAGVATYGHPVEVSPLFALDADELKRKLQKGFTVSGPTYLR